MGRLQKLSNFLWMTILLAVIFLFTFPNVSPDYGRGLDPSYIWGLNWLFAHDYDTLTGLIYPYGPLAFLRVPTYEGSNFILFLLFLTLIKLSFVVLGMSLSGVLEKDNSQLGKPEHFRQWFVPATLLFLASNFVIIDSLIIFNCLFLSLIYLRKQKWWAFVSASALAIFSLFIKVSIGVNSLSVIAVSILIYFIEYRNPKALAFQFTSFIALLLLLSLLILRHPATIINWYVGAFHLVFGYGSLNLDYANHAVWITLFILSFFLCPLVCKDKSSRHACFMMIIPLFASWKHGIIREDCYHYFGMVYFVIVFWLTVALLEESRKAPVMLLGIVSVLSVMLNAAEMEGYDRKNSHEICSVTHITGPFFHYKQYISDIDYETKCSLQQSQLCDTMRQLIGDSSIDIYPFEFSYAAQNQLNWQPRAALGTALSPWLEQKSARNFSEKQDAIQFVLWHFQADAYGNFANSIDNRYFLNDEPEVVRNILNHYEPVATDGQLMLLSRTDKPAFEDAVYDPSFEAQWDEWVEVPPTERSVIRVKVHSAKNFRGKLRSAFYKDNFYFIEYQTTEGNSYSYRYDPALATEGLWCTPLVQLPCDSAQAPRIARFRLSTSNKNLVKPQVRLQFEYLGLTGERSLFISKE